MSKSDHRATDSQRPTPAFLGSPTQGYNAASAPTWTRIDVTCATSPAFLGSPTQRYHHFSLAAQTAAAVIRRILLKLSRASTRSTQRAQPKGPLPRAPQN